MANKKKGSQKYKLHSDAYNNDYAHRSGWTYNLTNLIAPP